MKFKLNGWTPCRISSNSMQSDAKVKKKMCDKLPNGRYDIEESSAVFADYFRPWRSKGTCHFSENLLFLNDSKNLFHILWDSIKCDKMNRKDHIFGKVFYHCRTRKLGELPKFARCTISSYWITFGATKSYLTSYLIAEKQPSRYL